MRSSNTSSGSGANEYQGRFSHLRNMRVLCKPFVELGACDIVDCPYSHKVGDFRIPGEQCRFEVCKMTMCEFFHGTAEQWKALKHHRDTAIPTPTTYRPSDYLELRDPHVEASRTPAPSGIELVAGVRQHLMGNLPPAQQQYQAIPSATAGGGGGGLSMVPSSPSVALPPPSATSQLGTAPGISQSAAMTQAPVVIQAPQVTMLQAANGPIVAWFCGQCNTQNSVDRVQCTHCEVAPPWNCAMCHTANFGSRRNCIACRANHPQLAQQFVNNQQQQVPLVMQLPMHQQQQQQQQPPHQYPTGMLPAQAGSPHFIGNNY